MSWYKDQALLARGQFSRVCDPESPIFLMAKAFNLDCHTLGWGPNLCTHLAL